MAAKWRSMSDFKPDDFELVHIRYESGKVRPAWWTGQIWDSRVQITQSKVVAWKPIHTPTRPRREE